jgi:hypothetical protein
MLCTSINEDCMLSSIVDLCDGYKVTFSPTLGFASDKLTTPHVAMMVWNGELPKSPLNMGFPHNYPYI